jgi:hypothetical protein
MGMRHFAGKTKSEIVFDITGGEKLFTTMNLATIPKRPKFVRADGGDFSLRTDDIDGARAKSSPIKTRHHTLNITDIEGARPASAFDPGSLARDVMKVRDIDGSAPRIYKNLPHSSRHTNPLTPEYQLPTKEELPPPEIPFIYDGINFDDIPGVHPRSYKSDKPPRDPLLIDDIPGTRSRSLLGPYDRGNRYMDVSDINGKGKRGQFNTKRRTNPLNPDYPYDGTVLTADYGSPESNYLTREDGIDTSLMTQDIEGAQVTDFGAKYPPRAVPLSDDEISPRFPLMLPSMYKQTAELERQKAMNKIRGERIRKFESRHLGAQKVRRMGQSPRARVQPRQIPITL